MRGPDNDSGRRGRDEDGDVIEAEFDWNETPPAVAVVETVSVVTNTDIRRLEPLFEHLDPDSLNALVGHEGGPRAGTVVTFEIAGFETSVYADGRLRLSPVGTTR